MAAVIIIGSLVSLCLAASLYGGWTFYRSRDAVREWKQRCEDAERRSAVLERHLAALAKVIHHNGGGVVQRYYEISALRFLLMKKHPSAWGADSSIPQWLRAHSDFLHDIAERAQRIGTTDEMRRRIEAVRIGHGDELSSYALPVDSAPSTAAGQQGTADGEEVAIEMLEREALLCLLQVADALAFSGRFVSAEHGGRGSALAGVERMCREAEKIIHAQPLKATDRTHAIVAAVDEMRDALGAAWLAGPAAVKPTPSSKRLDELKAAAMELISAGKQAAVAE